jgi:hypothetical protein
MKTIIVLALALFSLGLAQTKSKAIAGNVGQSIPLFGSAPNGEPLPSSQVNLDTSELDTSKYFYELIDKPINSTTDTLGHVSFECKDSTGTDSIGVRLRWYFNTSPNGTANWRVADSVTITGTGSSYLNATATPIVNALGYMAIKFEVKNIKVSAVGLKPTCRNFLLDRRKRTMVPL